MANDGAHDITFRSDEKRESYATPPSGRLVPINVHANALGSGRGLIQIDGAHRANSFNYYKQVVGVDAQPVKLLNDEGTQQTIENLPVGATVLFTVTGVNEAGEGQPGTPVSLVIT